MAQMTFSDLEYQDKKHKTRRELFLERMEILVPWNSLEDEISPHYYPQGQQGRPPYDLSVMLRVHCMQLFYNLSDPAMEDALYEIESMRRFAGLRLCRIPDETTILNFRHFLEHHGLGERLFQTVNDHLQAKGLLLREGSIVDATIIAAPSSTKNSTAARDPEMHQTRKGNQWYFGMKMHIGVDDQDGLIHTMATTPANVSDVVMAGELLHGEERRVHGDAGYLGINKRKEHQHRQGIAWQIALRPGQRRVMDPASPQARAEKRKASIRAKVEHPFRMFVAVLGKQVFGYAKVRYRGLHKNTNRLYLLAAFTNLLIGERYVLT